MLIKQAAGLKQLNSIGKSYIRLFVLLCIGFIYHSHPQSLYGDDSNDMICNSDFKMTAIEASRSLKQSTLLGDLEVRAKKCRKQRLTYYLYIADFAQSFIEIPTSNVSDPSSTISSRYLAGRAAIYDEHNIKVGTCSASFLCMQNQDGIYTDISNFLSVDNGLIVSWFTPTTLINLELDSIIHGMVTECIVTASTKVGFNPFFGKTFDLTVSSDNERIYFKFSKR